MMAQNTLVETNTFSTDEIRQIQMLLVLFSCLPPNGKLHEIFKHALELPHDSWLARVTPVTDESFDGLKSWLESLWVQEGLTRNEQKLVEWQNTGEHISAAVRELKAVEKKLGFKLGVKLTK